jgi:hypothetical protein
LIDRKEGRKEDTFELKKIRRHFLSWRNPRMGVILDGKTVIALNDTSYSGLREVVRGDGIPDLLEYLNCYSQNFNLSEDDIIMLFIVCMS